MDSEDFGADAGVVALLKRFMPRPLYELLELAYSGADYRRLKKAILRHRPDCLYERYNLFLPSGVWARERFRLPLLLEVNAPLLEERATHDGLALERLARWSEQRAWRGADRVLPVTEVLADHVERAGVPRSRIEVVPNGVDREDYERVADREEAKRRLGLEGRLVLGFTGFRARLAPDGSGDRSRGGTPRRPRAASAAGRRRTGEGGACGSRGPARGP